MRRYLPIAAVLTAFLFAGVLFAYYTPYWQAPDEPAHYNYIRQLADGTLPLIEPGDYNQAYQSEVISSKFDTRYDIEPFMYEDYQPPLYYLLQTPVYLLTGGSLFGLRLLSVAMGAGIVLLTFLVASTLFPDRIWVALTAAVFVAFLPQHVAMMSAVNNDALAELLIAAMLLLLVRIVMSNRSVDAKDHRTIDRSVQWQWLVLGLLLGLGFLTKVTAYILVPVILVTQLWLYRGRRAHLVQAMLLVFGPALILGLLWWIRNIIVYDDLDPLGTIAHNEVVVGQPRTSEWIADMGLAAFLGSFLRTTFRSFWGQFGWMGVPMPGWVYVPLLLFSLGVVLGLIWNAARSRLGGPKEDAEAVSETSAPWIILLAVFLLSLATYLAYNVTFVQHQGRYLFPSLIPIGLGAALGLAAFGKPLSDRRAGAVYIIPLGLAAALFLLDIVALFWFIIPSLT